MGGGGGGEAFQTGVFIFSFQGVGGVVGERGGRVPDSDGRVGGVGEEKAVGGGRKSSSDGRVGGVGEEKADDGDGDAAAW